MQSASTVGVMLTAVELIGCVKTWLSNKAQDDFAECKQEALSALDRDCLHYNDIFAPKFGSCQEHYLDTEITDFLDYSDQASSDYPCSQLGKY